MCGGEEEEGEEEEEEEREEVEGSHYKVDEVAWVGRGVS